MAPTVTDREKFKMIGFDFPADFVPATDDEATLFNERVMAAYAMWRSPGPLPMAGSPNAGS
jgi:hypothetical protein